jgi:hypothetical protein
MRRHNKLYKKWKNVPRQPRQILAFLLGVFLIIISPLVGTVPGPGGIAVFVLGTAVLASEFDWAESVKIFFLKTVPKEFSNRWQPTPRWQRLFDVTAFLLLVGAAISTYYHVWYPVLSLGIGGVSIFVFNRNRLERCKKRFRRRAKR